MSENEILDKAHLEVKDKATGEWQSAGPVHLAQSHAELPVRRQLPKAVKNCLAPNCNSKEDRRSYYLYRHSQDKANNTNLLILLHGAGDTHLPFDKMGQTMKLPQTATLAISSLRFHTLPLGLGHTWFQEMDYATGETLPADHPVRRSSIDAAVSRFAELLNLLLDHHWMVAERIFFIGYGAGACLIMEFCQSWSQNARLPFGGGICVGGGNSGGPSKGFKSLGTPILLVCGEHDETFTAIMAHQAKDGYEQACGNGLVEIHTQPNKKTGMISSENEMRAVMAFLAPRLVRISQMGAK